MSSEPKTIEAETYKDFAITPDPMPAEGGFRVRATIAKGDKSHLMIRADVISDRDAAREASVAKARQMIDEQGEHLFG